MRNETATPCRTGITSSWNFNSSRFTSWPAWKSPAENGSKAMLWRICLDTGCFIHSSKWHSHYSKRRQKLCNRQITYSSERKLHRCNIRIELFSGWQVYLWGKCSLVEYFCLLNRLTFWSSTGSALSSICPSDFGCCSRKHVYRPWSSAQLFILWTQDYLA